MNNKVYFYRVANEMGRHYYDAHYMGPYAYFNINSWLKASIPFTEETYLQFVKFASQEVVEYRRYNIDNYKLKSVPTLPNTWRPGPFEDIDLREKMIQRMGKMTKNGKFHLYGFDSLMQTIKWYSNLEELEFLEKNGFSLYKLLVKSSNLIVGKNQAVYFPDKYDIVEKAKIKLTDLHKQISISTNNNKVASKLFV